MSDIKFQASVDSKKGETSLKQLDAGVGKIEKSTKKAGGGFKSLAVGVAAGVAAFALASKALRGLVRWMGDAVDKAATQQMAESEVAAALESTGREVLANTEHFKKYASELQGATIFGDEQVLSAQALMIQLTKLDQQGLDAATKGAIGLASVYKTDLQAATTLVGKALAGNYGALSRYGIMVERTATDEQKRASILIQLQTMYKRAEAETDTYRGAVKQLSNVYGDLKEQVGDAVVENETFRDLITTTTEAVGDLIDSGFIEWFTDVAALAVKSYPAFELLSVSMQAMAVILRSQAEEQKKANEITQEWIASLSLNDELQQQLRESIAENIVVTIEQSEATMTLAERAGEAFDRLTAFEERQRDATETAKLFSAALKKNQKNIQLVGVDYGLLGQGIDWLGIHWEQFLAGFEEGNQNMQIWLADTLGIWTEASQAEWDLMNTTKDTLKELTSFEQMALAEMQAGYQGIIGTILSVLEKWAIGEIVKSVMKLPFPINLLATAGAIAAVKAIFAGIKGMKEGGMVEKEGIYHLHAGEEVRPASEVNNIYNQSSSARSQTVNYNITYAPRISAMDSRDVSRFMAGPGRVALISMLRDNRRGFTREIKTEINKF